MFRRDDLFLSSRASAHKGGEIIEYNIDFDILFSLLFTVKLFFSFFSIISKLSSAIFTRKAWPTASLSKPPLCKFYGIIAS